MIAMLKSSLSASSLAWRGFMSVVFGIVALAWPGVTLAALTFLFGAYAVVDGLFALVVALQGKHPHRWLLVLDGVLGLAVGVLTMFWPGVTLLFLVFLVGARFLLTGGFQLATAIKLRKMIPTPILYGIGGVASIVIGVLAFAMPGITAFVLVTMLGVYALFFGFVFLTLAVMVWRATHRGGTPAAAGAA